jgi:centriolar protein POC1
VTGVSFNPNMKQLVSSSLDSALMVWNFKPNLRAFRFLGHKVEKYFYFSNFVKASALSVEFSPSGNLIASGAKDATIRLWLPTVYIRGTCVTNKYRKGSSTKLKAHSGSVRSISFSKEGKSLVSASDDKTVKALRV